MNIPTTMWKMLSRHCFETISRIPSQICNRSLVSRSMHSVCAHNSSGILPRITSITAGTSDLLRITTVPLYVPTCGFKVKGKLKLRCKDCYFVTRQERLYVFCKSKPRHKQMAMKAKPHNTWILTHATQGPQRAW